MAAADVSKVARRRFGWPKDCKPKCLHSFKGEVLLARQMRMFKQFGINDVRMLVCYKKEMIMKFAKNRGFKIKFIYNPDWGNALRSLRMVLEGVDDDVVFIFGDVYVTEGTFKALIEDKHPFATAYTGGTMKMPKNPVKGCIHMNKIKRGKIGYLLNTMATPEYRVDRPEHGFWPFAFFFGNQGDNCSKVKGIDGLRDIDKYWATDEYKQSLLRGET